MNLIILEGQYAICRLSAEDDIPQWIWGQKTLLSITYTTDELSIVCPAFLVPATVRCEKNWSAIKVVGPLDFALTGILASLTRPLADAGISIFALSTFDTDYLLVKEESLALATTVLKDNGYHFV